MSWSSAFIDKLSTRNRAIKFFARVVQPANNAGPGGSGDLPEVKRVSVRGGRLTPVTWASTFGGFTVVISTTNAANVHGILRRGSIVEVHAGFDGWSESQYEVICRGRVRTVSGTYPEFAIECVDLLGALVTRPASGNIERQFLFYDGGAPVAAAGNGYNLTFSSETATTLVMTSAIDTTKFVYDSSVAAGLLKVEDSGGDYYVTYTGISGSTFTGVQAVGAGSFGTTRPATTSASANVVHVPYLRDHPADIARRMLVSTGAGTNGTYDTAPEPWGFAFDDSWISHSGFNRWSTLVMTATSGTYEWEVRAEARQTSGLSWLTPLMSAAGCWLTMRQGQVTFRAAQDLYPPTRDSGFHIVDDYIAQVLAYSAWDPSVPAEYGRVKLTGPTTVQTTDSTNGVGSVPGGYVKEYDLSSVAWQNESAVLAGDRNRLLEWGFVVPELVKLRTSSLRFAQLAAGDYVRVSSRRLAGRLERADSTFDERRAMVTSVTPHWMDGVVDVELSLPPEKNDSDQG